MDLLETQSFEQIQNELHLTLLPNAVSYALTGSSFYRKKFSGFNLDTHQFADWDIFSKLPFTSKSELLVEQEANPPFGGFSGCRDLRAVVRVHRTSGTTGRPLFIPMSSQDIQSTLTAGKRAFDCAGLLPSDRVVHCLNYCMWAGGVTDHLSLEATGAVVIPYGVGNTHQLIETILTLGINAISCTPSYLNRLGEVLDSEFGMRPHDLGLTKAFFGGEGGLQNPAVRGHIEATWALQAIDANYGMADVLSIFGSECEDRSGLHFHGQGIIHIELIDPSTECGIELCEGAEGELVLTNLVRECQPLVRYRTGDVVSIRSLQECSCGRRSPRFVVVGRSDQMVVVRGVNVYPGGIKNLLNESPNNYSGEFRIFLDNPPPHDRVVLQVEVKNIDNVALDTLIANLRMELKHRLNFSPELELIPSGNLPRTEGKTSYVIRSYTN